MEQPRPKETTYTADFKTFGNGDNLNCTNQIAVNWTKPSADTAELRLICNCGAHTSAGCLPPSNIPIPAGASSGTSMFVLTHCTGTHKTGVVLRTEIWHSGAFQAGNNRIGIPVNCPASGGNGGLAHQHGVEADPLIITLESDGEPVGLARSADKCVWGRFNHDFGEEVIVAVQQKFPEFPGQEATRYVTAAKKSWLDALLGRKIRRWRATLPHELWDAEALPLIIRLFLTRRSDGAKHAASVGTTVT